MHDTGKDGGKAFLQSQFSCTFGCEFFAFKKAQLALGS